MFLKKNKVYVAGHNGLVGSAIIRRLKFFGYKNIIIDWVICWIMQLLHLRIDVWAWK